MTVTWNVGADRNLRDDSKMKEIKEEKRKGKIVKKKVNSKQWLGQKFSTILYVTHNLSL